MRCKRFTPILILFLAACVRLTPAADTGLESLPSPLAFSVVAASPARLIDAVDTAGVAFVKGTSAERKFMPGMVKVLFNMGTRLPVLVTTPGLGLEMAAVLQKGPAFDAALILTGLPGDRLRSEMKKAGYVINKRGDTYQVKADAVASGLTFSLVDLDDSRVLAAQSAESAARFAGILKDWRPAPLAGGDIRVTVDARRVRDVFPEQLAELRSKLGDEQLAAFVATRPSSLSEDAARRMAETLFALGKQYIDLATDPDLVELTLTLDDAFLTTSLALSAPQDTLLGDFIARQEGRENPEYRLIRAVSDDAVLLSAGTRAGGTLFPDGDLFTGPAFAFARAFGAAERQEAEALQRDFAANRVEEEVSGYYLKDNSVRRVSYSRVADGREYLGLLSRAADCFNAISDYLEAESPKGKQQPTHLAKEDGKAGNIAYRRLFVQVEDGAQKDAQLLRSFSLYLAANRDMVMTLLGQNLEPDSLPAAVARLDPKARNALVDSAEAAAALERLKHRQVEQAVFKPIAWFDFIRRFAPGADSRPAEKAELQDSGSFAAYAVGSRPGALIIDFVLPYAVVNDIAVSQEQSLEGK